MHQIINGSLSMPTLRRSIDRHIDLWAAGRGSARLLFCRRAREGDATSPTHRQEDSGGLFRLSFHLRRTPSPAAGSLAMRSCALAALISPRVLARRKRADSPLCPLCLSSGAKAWARSAGARARSRRLGMRFGQGRGPKASPCQATAAAVRLRMSIRSLSGAPRRGSHVAPHRLLGHCPR